MRTYLFPLCEDPPLAVQFEADDDEAAADLFPQFEAKREQLLAIALEAHARHVAPKN